MAQVNFLGDFPWCPVIATNQEIGQGTEYPIGLTLVEMEAFYWRIKSFNVSVTSSIDEQYNTFHQNGKSTQTGFMYSGGEISSTGYTSETDLVCGPWLSFGLYGYWDTGATNMYSNLNLLAGGIGYFNGFYRPPLYSNGLYYPYIYFWGGMGPWTTNKSQQVVNKVQCTGSVVISSNYFNLTMPIYSYWTPSGQSDPTYSATTSTNVTLTANYWPYNP